MKKFFAAVCLASLLLGLAGTGCSARAPEEHKLSAEEPPAEEPALPAAPPEEEETQHPEEETAEPAPPPVEEPPSEPATASYIKIKTDGLNVRSGAGTGFPSLGTLDKNTLLQFTAEQNGWYKTYYRGRTAFVSAREEYAALTGMETGDEKTERVIEEGFRLLGVRYVYGATRLHDGKGNFLKGFTAEKFDCSSLMQYIFYKGGGVLLDVTTRTQVLQGKEVKLSGIARGDLLFFTNASRKNKTGIERVGHVALYLGDGYILHTASDYARVEELTPARKSNFLTARRIL